MTVDPVDAPVLDLALLEEAILLEEIEIGTVIEEGVVAVVLNKTMLLNSSKSLSFLAQRSWVQVQMCLAHRSALLSLQTWPCSKT